jgi:signal transduction histidine kinase
MRFRLNWSMVLLGVSLSALGILARQAHLADRRHRETAASVLNDYAKIAVYNYHNILSNQLGNAVRTTLMHSGGHLMRHRPATGVPSLASLVAMEDNCGCSKPPLQVQGTLLYSFTHDSLQTMGADLPVPSRTELIAALTDDYREVYDNRDFVLRTIGNTDAFLAYKVLQRTPADTLLLGVWFDGREVRSILEKAFCPDGLLPEDLRRGRPIESVVTLAVYSPGRIHPLWASAPSPVWQHAVQDTLAPALGGLVTRAQIRPELAELLIIGGLPRSRLPLLLGLLGISFGLAILAAVQMRREQALVKLRESFVTSVSHELRTPLAQIRLFLETVRMGRAASNAEREWALSHIERETTRLTHLVENVLHVSRPRQNEQVAAAPVVNLRDEIGEIVQSFLPIARSKRARIVVQLEPDALAAIRREHLRQLLLNLLDNAVKYGPTGQTVTVSAQTCSDRVCISVSDQGPGVLPAERERVWNAFVRGTTPEALASGGTGIGLSIVRDLVTQYGGTIELDPTGPGANFVISLPRIALGPRVDADTTVGTAVHAG